MITTRTNHHEQSFALLPAIGSAVTIIVCYLKLKLEQHEARKGKKP